MGPGVGVVGPVGPLTATFRAEPETLGSGQGRSRHWATDSDSGVA